MNYVVDWDDPALAVLTDIWTQAPDRAAVTAAAHRIDTRLAADPVGSGAAVSEGLYGIDVPPLRAVYEVDPSARTVSVVGLSWLP